MNRETWLNEVAALTAPRFQELGFPLPAFKVAIGFPSAGTQGNVAGECWSPNSSADQVFNIFIRPDAGDAITVTRTLVHELAHAAVGFDCGHKGDFATVMLALGYGRPLTSSGNATKAFDDYITPIIEQVGPMPHAALTWPGSRNHPGVSAEESEDEAVPEKANSNQKKKQTTRMLKATCQAINPNDGSGDIEPGATCGYTVRLSKKWAKKYGACCPVHGGIEIEGLDDEGGEDDADQ